VAAPMFVIGGSVNGGLHGTYPSLTDLNSGDLKMSVDFRQVYASVLEGWLNIPSSGILGGSFAPLSLFGPTVTCVPRPPVKLTSASSGGMLQVTLQAGGGVIREIRFGPTQNATVDVGNLSGQTGSFTYRPASPSAQIPFFVRKLTTGPSTVPIVVVDDCGEWKSFVGGGTAAF